MPDPNIYYRTRFCLFHFAQFIVPYPDRTGFLCREWKLALFPVTAFVFSVEKQYKLLHHIFRFPELKKLTIIDKISVKEPTVMVVNNSKDKADWRRNGL